MSQFIDFHLNPRIVSYDLKNFQMQILCSQVIGEFVLSTGRKRAKGGIYIPIVNRKRDVTGLLCSERSSLPDEFEIFKKWTLYNLIQLQKI